MDGDLSQGPRARTRGGVNPQDRPRGQDEFGEGGGGGSLWSVKVVGIGQFAKENKEGRDGVQAAVL